MAPTSEVSTPNQPTAVATGRPDVAAAVDLGSNSVHLLVAGIVGHRLAALVDESVFLGLGDAVAERGHLGRASRRELVAALAWYAETGRRLGASEVTFIGTEPIRRAADASTVVHEVLAATGVALHVLSHEEEALLTLIGVTEGRPVEHELLVIDIGGGSSEFSILEPGSPPRAVGIRVGSARLTADHVGGDPPTDHEVAAMRAAAADAIGQAPDAHPAMIVAVGGTASNLLKVLPAAAADRSLSAERIAEAIAAIASEPAGPAAERHGIRASRARVLAAGGAILEAVVHRYGLDHIEVSEASVREGTIMAAHHAPIAWRDQLSLLARGWRD